MPSLPRKAESNLAAPQQCIDRRYAEDQVILDNAHYLWLRFVREERSYMDESAEQLRSLSYLAVLVAGFVLVAFIQFGFDASTVSEGVLVTFAVSNSLTVALNLGCMTSASSMLSCGFKTYTGFLTDDQEADYLQRCVRFARSYKPGARPPQPQHSFRLHWEKVSGKEWRLLLIMFAAGVAAFLVNLASAAFIKFAAYLTPAILLATPLGLGALYFYAALGRWLPHLLFQRPTAETEEPPTWDPVGLPFDWHLPPRDHTPAAALTGALAPATLAGRKFLLTTSSDLSSALRGSFRRIAGSPQSSSPLPLVAPSGGPLAGTLRGVSASLPSGSTLHQQRLPGREHSQTSLRPSPAGPTSPDHPTGDAWRQEEWVYASLQQARLLWLRHVRRHRVDMEERAEQVRSFAFLSGILGGFAIASVLQLVFDTGTTPSSFQLGFAVTVGLAVACAVTAMAMHSLVLLSVLQAAPALVAPAEEAHFMEQCRRFALEYKPGRSPPAPKRTFRKYWAAHCASEFARAFYCFIFGLLALVINFIFGAWIKYGTDRPAAALSATVVLSVGLAFQLYTMVRWVPFLLHGTKLRFKADDAEVFGLPLDWRRAPQKE